VAGTQPMCTLCVWLLNPGEALHQHDTLEENAYLNV
jgi:hypothetical protein